MRERPGSPTARGTGRVGRIGVALVLLLLAACEGGPVQLPEIRLTGVELPRLPRLSDLFASGVSRLRPGDELVVEAAISGERCHLREHADGGVFEDFAVFCEGWSQPSGWLRRAPKAVDDALLERLLGDRRLSLVAPGAAECGPVEAISSTPPVRIRVCTASDGWPMLLWASPGEIEGAAAVSVAFGPPQLAPVFEAATRGSGEALRAGSESPLVRYARLQAEAGGRFVGLGEIMDHRELVELGRRHNQAGEFAEAIRAYERALELQRRGQGGDAFTASLLAALGLNYASDGRLADAERAFAAAATQLPRIAWSDQYPRILSYRAAYSRMRGDLAAAEADAREAVERWTALLGPDAPPVAHAHLVAAGIDLARGDIDAARSRLERAISIYERHRDRVGAAFARARLALVEERAGRSDAALAAANHARDLMAALFGDSRNLVDAELVRGRLAARSGDLQVAREAFSAAARLVEYGRYGDRALAPDDLAVWLGLLATETGGATPDEDTLAEIVRAVQLVRSSVFDTALRRMAVRVAAADAEIGRAVATFEALREREAGLQLALGRLQLDDAFAPPAEEEERLRAELARVRQELAKRERELQARFPRYGGLVTARPESLASLRRMLRPHEAVLRVLTTADATWSLLLGGDGRARFVRAGPGEEELAGEIRGLRQALTFEHGLVPYDLRRAWNLYRTLFGPLAAELEDVGHLIVVADGPLSSLPLAVLPVEPPVGDDDRQVAWLGTRHAVSVLPSLAALGVLRLRTGPSRAQLAFLGVGDPVLGGEGPSRGAITRALEACLADGRFEPLVLRAMPALPETAQELTRVASAIGGRTDLLLRERARESVVRRRPLDRYRILSFATHGLLPGELPCRNEPGLVLTPPDRADGTDDGFLAAGEIATLRLDADWVVLSACNTAGPDGSLGGGSLSGLATGFAHAGARALLVSHWDVESDATVRLITATFRHYAADPAAGKAAALLAARRQLAADPERAHPAFWAAFDLVGDGGAEGPTG